MQKDNSILFGSIIIDRVMKCNFPTEQDIIEWIDYISEVVGSGNVAIISFQLISMGETRISRIDTRY
jgi:hypothetical protein